ncbi:tRNA methyltransferase complex GCD14 subunit [Jaminaea rosea]|uniref:tRNA (adenine(58)-N(1))-methyltransferase catalytic subunit TRM61 n=1 Tax=Jaminaea rosea TaxID=1569628 RepID=A0A316UK22_9BASI|nr:tRNA methyltransferase complex GCD14 subunit [Jaminaea rosea]PWN25284.1 tRNA methyltransferase complex GCD14 subunit [Jaminaea rosea]
MDLQASTSTSMAGSLDDSLFIAEGNLVILYMSRDRPPIPLCVTPGATYANNYGVFPHSSILGQPYGSVLHSAPPSRGFVTLLRPTPELWTLALPHRTQILYAPDMSFIASKLALGPGAKVVEAGTGSGSFTHFLARCVGSDDGDRKGTALGYGWKGLKGMGISAKKGERVQTRPPRSSSNNQESEAEDGSPANEGSSSSRQASPPFKEAPTPGAEMDARIAQAQAQAAPTPDDESASSSSSSSSPPNSRGRVYSFEFHLQRSERAREEFLSHSLTPSLVSLSHRNVCLSGFPSSLNGQADAAFLDLPAPWEAIPFLTAVLSPSSTTRVCCFSPCIEQVLRTVKALNCCGFREVETYECLVRTHESVFSGQGGEGRDVSEVKGRLREVGEKRRKASELQRRRALERKARKAGQQRDEVRGEDEGADEDGEDKQHQENGGNGSHSAKRQRRDDSPAGDNEDDDDDDDQKGATSKITMSGHGVPIIRSNVHSRVHPTMRGHTSYLTFAVLLPRFTTTSQ